ARRKTWTSANSLKAFCFASALIRVIRGQDFLRIRGVKCRPKVAQARRSAGKPGALQTLREFLSFGSAWTCSRVPKGRIEISRLEVGRFFFAISPLEKHLYNIIRLM